ncbi:hypothetical protein [Rhodococcoides corynebacterioides]|uniref:hypothetical protein n=1 Tax=Rhodococcoides corynebacterioides TaxID=53972 RepID=UPI001C9B1C2E|nr:hypothetical protein [Rhodococcus corynebacterioides]
MVIEVDDTNSMHVRAVGVYDEDVAFRRSAELSRTTSSENGRALKYKVSDALPPVGVGGFELTVHDGHAHLYLPPHASVIVHMDH